MASPLAKAKERPSSKVLCFFLPEWEKAYTTLVRKSISLEVALFQEGGEILDVGEVEEVVACRSKLSLRIRRRRASGRDVNPLT
jgi:hypothetical protein